MSVIRCACALLVTPYRLRTVNNWRPWMSLVCIAHEVLDQLKAWFLVSGSKINSGDPRCRSAQRQRDESIARVDLHSATIAIQGMHSSGCVVYSAEFKLRVNVRDYPTASNGLAPMERTIGKLPLPTESDIRSPPGSPRGKPRLSG